MNTKTRNTIGSQIKKELKGYFPNIKFSVRYSSYSGGDSVDVYWTCGPTCSEVDEIIKKYQGGHFDGMNDMYVHRDADKLVNENGELVERQTAKYVSSSRTIPEDFAEAVSKAICQEYGVEYTGAWDRIENHNEYASTLAYRVLRRASFQTDSPVYKGLIHLPVGCGHFEDFYAVAVEETVKGETIATDGAKLIEGVYAKRITQLEKDYYAMVAERDQLRGELSNLQRKLEEEKKDRTRPTLVQPDTMFIEGVMYANLNKQDRLESYHAEVSKGDYSAELTRVTEIVMVTDEHYELLKDNLLSDFDYLKGKGGHDSKYKLPAEYQDKQYWEWPKEEMANYKAQMFREALLVYHPTKELFLIDPQGYSYARYVGLIDETTQKDLREFIENM